MNQTTTAGNSGAGRVFLVAAGAIALLLIGVALGRASASGSPSSTTTATAAPTTTAMSTLAPTPIMLSGTGSKVLTVTLAAGRYKVSWSAQGHDNFIVHLLGDNDVAIVNEVPPNPASGETVLSVRDGGGYQMEVQAATLAWTITLGRL